VQYEAAAGKRFSVSRGVRSRKI